MNITESGKALIIIRQAEQMEKALAESDQNYVPGFSSAARNWNALLTQAQGLFKDYTEFSSSIAHLQKYSDYYSDDGAKHTCFHQIRQELPALKGAVLAFLDLSNNDQG